MARPARGQVARPSRPGSVRGEDTVSARHREAIPLVPTLWDIALTMYEWVKMWLSELDSKHGSVRVVHSCSALGAYCF